MDTITVRDHSMIRGIRKEEMLYIFLLPSFFLRLFLLVKYRMVLFLQASTFFFLNEYSRKRRNHALIKLLYPHSLR